MRKSLGTWSAWTPFFVPCRNSFSSPLCRKLTITPRLYRVPLRDTALAGQAFRPWQSIAAPLGPLSTERLAAKAVRVAVVSTVFTHLGWDRRRRVQSLSLSPT